MSLTRNELHSQGQDSAGPYYRSLDSTAHDWLYRRVVVGTDTQNQPFFARDELVRIAASDTTGYYPIWAGDELPLALPSDGENPVLTESAADASGSDILKHMSYLPKPASTGFRVFWYEFGPRYKGEDTTPFHWHDSTEIWSISEGEVVLILAGGAEKILRKGESVVVTGIDHRWENRSGKSAIASVVWLASLRQGAAPLTGCDMTEPMSARTP